MPAPGDLSERLRVDGVQLVPAVAARLDEPGALEHGEVLGDRLPCRAQTMLCGEPGAELEQRLVISLAQLVEDRPTGVIGQRPVDVIHGRIIGK